jgi:uncharacterized protein (DUF924 family)
MPKMPITTKKKDGSRGKTLIDSRNLVTLAPARGSEQSDEGRKAMVNPDEILAFWLDEIGTRGWYSGGEDLDALVRDRFAEVHEQACAGGLSLWLTYPAGTLAYVILTDQFPRNMFRDTPKAFATDGIARAAAKVAISRGWDMKIDEPARQFFYMPLVHSECLSDQDRAVRLIMSRMPEAGASNLLHAKAHREVVRRFGRFPTRNAALGRATPEAEAAYLREGGYGAIVASLKERDAA